MGEKKKGGEGYIHPAVVRPYNLSHLNFALPSPATRQIHSTWRGVSLQQPPPTPAEPCRYSLLQWMRVKESSGSIWIMQFIQLMREKERECACYLGLQRHVSYYPSGYTRFRGVASQYKNRHCAWHSIYSIPMSPHPLHPTSHLLAAAHFHANAREQASKWY